MPDLSFSSDGFYVFQVQFKVNSLRLIGPFAPCNGIQESLLDSGFWIPHSGFRISGTGFLILCQWNLDSGFNREIPDSAFQNPGPSCSKAD